VQAVLPHTALQSVVSSSGLACPPIGFVESEKPLGSQERIRPALMILRGTTKARTFFPLPQERPESATDKTIDITKRRESRVFEVAKPPPQERIEFGNDLRQAPAARPTRVLADLVPPPLQTLGTHVPPSPSKSVAQQQFPLSLQAQ